MYCDSFHTLLQGDKLIIIKTPPKKSCNDKHRYYYDIYDKNYNKYQIQRSTDVKARYICYKTSGKNLEISLFTWLERSNAER